jgi:DNA-binding GntR family transcriptional regulator
MKPQLPRAKAVGATRLAAPGSARDEPKTQEELAYEQLKAMILAGELPRDEFLSQRMLAAKAGTNITTVRTALRHLENDGLLENIPHWGVRIPGETEERLRDLYFMRELLEVGAVRRFVQNRASIDTRRIVALARLCDSLASKLPASLAEFSQAHFDFHMEIASQGGSELLMKSLNRLHFRNWLLSHDSRLWTRGDSRGATSTPPAPPVAPKEYRDASHQKMVEALLHGSEEQAANEMRRHIYAGLRQELAVLGASSGSGAKPPTRHGRPRIPT